MAPLSLVVGVDIGNSTTEACAALLADDGAVEVVGTGLAPTTGTKGTPPNVTGARRAIRRALEASGRRPEDVERVLVNEATPVISGVAMETLTETIITESTMIGHNPQTPGGEGLGVGTTTALADLDAVRAGAEVIVVVPHGVDFEEAAGALRAARERGVELRGAVVGADDARLIANRLARPVPIVDEVTHVDRVPLGMLAAVEVAPAGRNVRTLANSYGLATVFGLDGEQTKLVAPVARALVGTRSAVVVRTPAGDVRDRRIPAGSVTFVGERTTVRADVGDGAAELMRALGRVQPLEDALGEDGSHVGGMLATVRETMADLTGEAAGAIRIRDVLAADTFVPQEVRGGLAGEFALEGAVALAAMVRTSRGPVEQVAAALREDLGCAVEIGGVEAEMAIVGARTTPGTSTPVAVLDLGGGSTDAALDPGDGSPVRTFHAAGAGDLVTRLIRSELGLDDVEVADAIKTCPLAKVESLFHVRLEDGGVVFYDEPLPAEAFARVVALADDGRMVPIPTRHDMGRIREVRRDAKRRVFVVNAVRALEQVAPRGNVRLVDFVVVIGGSALDFEIGDLVAERLAEHGIVCGTGNVRATQGPRNAVATGLVLSHARERAARRAADVPEGQAA